MHIIVLFIERIRRYFLQHPLLLPPLLCLGFFVLLFLLLRFSPYRGLYAFLERPCSTRFYDRHGNLVQIIPLEDGLRREHADIDSINPAIIDIFLTAEDERFFYHFGIDPLAVLRAFAQNIRAGRRISGASTISMQLARIITATVSPRAHGQPRRNIFSKAAETFNALRLETRLSKKEILSLYLNSIPFGFQTQGLASAARNFFASEIHLLTPAEAFCLAVIPRRPARYNPLIDKDTCIAAAQKLAVRFAENRADHLSASYSLYTSLNDDDWNVLRPARFVYPRHMPHLVYHVHGLLRRQKSGTPADYVLSADLGIQRLAENLIFADMRRHETSRLNNGAAIVIDNLTGEVLAWVGSADYNDAREGAQIDGVLTKNQMGSAMKPFLFALALENGIKPADVLADIPSKYGTEEIYIPRNFNNRFNGPVLFRTALASSLNIPAVELLYRLGVQNYGGFLSSIGFDLDAKTAEDAGLGLSLGNAPVRLLELAAAFTIFPRDGQTISLRFDPAENLDMQKNKQVISTDTARIISSILSDRRARLLAFGRGTNFETPFPSIFKTGTANQFQSIAAVGATTRFTTAVWMGNFTGETVIGRTGSSLPASVVRSLLIRLHSAPEIRNENFKRPSGWVLLPICTLSGLSPGGDCLSVIEEYFPSGIFPALCSWHSASGVVYPPEYQNWFLSLPRQGDMDYASASLEIITPRNNYSFLPSRGGGSNSIPVEVIGGINNELKVIHNGRTFNVYRPFVFFLPYTPGDHSLTVINGDESDTVQFIAE